MYTFLNQMGLRAFMRSELPALSFSWIVAELFYKFGSFTLECGSFFITWYAASFIISSIKKKP